MKKILLISHNASRTGAPLIVLEFLRWLKKNFSNSIQVDVLLLNGGVLIEEFKKESSNVFVFSEINKPLKFSEIIFSKIEAKLKIKRKSKESLFLNYLSVNKYNLIYANSVISLPIGTQLKKQISNSFLVLHVHELNTIIKQTIPDFKKYIAFVDKFIAVSNLVRDNLIFNYRINQDLIELVYEFAIVNDELCFKGNKVFTIGGSGLVHWRKGSDVFIQVARFFIKNYPEIKCKFVWVGKISKNDKFIIEEDLKKIGINDKVSFVGEIENPIKSYADFDVFLMTSREDPFPLVCIEMAKLGKPIVSFDNATGTNEFLNNNNGFIVEYLDIEAMGEKIKIYYDNPNLKIIHGEKNKEAFSNLIPEKICPQLYEVIEKYLE